jgi:hypothetical protein
VDPDAGRIASCTRLLPGDRAQATVSAVIAFRIWGPAFGAVGATGAIMMAAGLAFLALNLLPGRATPRSRQSPRR